MGASITVLSPHFDDAVLSATTQLVRPGARVVTVFAGAPPSSIERTRWDRITGARSSAERHRERAAEDDEATALLGCASHRLSEPENQYREQPPERDRLAEQLRSFMRDTAEVWLPAGIGGHPDHLHVRDAGLLAVESLDHEPAVFLYADLPYAIQLGWPSWVTGAPSPAFLDPDFWLDEELVRAGLDTTVLKAQSFELAAETRHRKEKAVLRYRTQLPGLLLTPQHPARWESILRCELAWEVASR